MTPQTTPTAHSFRPMSFWNASRRVFDLSLGEMLWSRRTIFMALVVGGPVLLAAIVKVVEIFGMSALRVNGQRVAGFGIFGVMIWMLFLRFIVPVLGVFYGTALMADEVEDKTITYLFTRPIPRGAVLFGKYLAYLACTMLVVLPSVMIVYFMLVPFNQLPATFGSLLVDLGLLGLGLAVYGAVFAFVGAFFKRPLRHRPAVRLRLGAGRAGPAGLPQAVHGRLLPAGPGAPRHAVRRGGQPPPGDVPDDPARLGLPGLAVWVFGRIFVSGDPWWSSARNTCSSSRRLAPAHKYLRGWNLGPAEFVY